MPASVLLLFSGLVPSSLLCLLPFCRPFVMDSVSLDDCERFLAFRVELRTPSRLKLAIRRELGDLVAPEELRFPLPFVTRPRLLDIGISIENLSLDRENVLPRPTAELGEASGEEFD